MFKGREDVYAIYWTKGTKNGFMPAKLYDPYFNRIYKKTANSTSTETINYLSLTEDQIQKHLEGRQLIGLYPLLQDNSSWLIVADFDKNSWLEDCRSFIKYVQAIIFRPILNVHAVEKVGMFGYFLINLILL
ncbi:hypothetical protein N824_21190 [Pedobacter sp. V48]|nr:hypothetical protein [Pedobacter sp. V48]ETZ22808.1 hypothetical protein N824_21190 [Pedobacter sp. V48]